MKQSKVRGAKEAHQGLVKKRFTPEVIANISKRIASTHKDFEKPAPAEISPRPL